MDTSSQEGESILTIPSLGLEEINGRRADHFCDPPASVNVATDLELQVQAESHWHRNSAETPAYHKDRRDGFAD